MRECLQMLCKEVLRFNVIRGFRPTYLYILAEWKRPGLCGRTLCLQRSMACHLFTARAETYKACVRSVTLDVPWKEAEVQNPLIPCSMRPLSAAAYQKCRMVSTVAAAFVR